MSLISYSKRCFIYGSLHPTQIVGIENAVDFRDVFGIIRTSDTRYVCEWSSKMWDFRAGVVNCLK